LDPARCELYSIVRYCIRGCYGFGAEFEIDQCDLKKAVFSNEEGAEHEGHVKREESTE
jgi:hypothetical protein